MFTLSGLTEGGRWQWELGSRTRGPFRVVQATRIVNKTYTCMGAMGVGSDYFDGQGLSFSDGEAWHTKRIR